MLRKQPSTRPRIQFFLRQAKPELDRLLYELELSEIVSVAQPQSHRYLRVPREIKGKTLLPLLAMTWFMDSNLGSFVNTELLKINKYRRFTNLTFNLHKGEDSRTFCAMFLDWYGSDHDFYGNISRNMLKALKSSSIRTISPKRAQAIRRIGRGYRDKGSLIPSHKKLSTSDLSLSSRQRILEVAEDVFQKIRSELSLPPSRWS